MTDAIGTFDLDDYRALLRLAEGDVPFAAKIAKATLVIVEARRDAEVRAAAVEATLEGERGKLDAVRALLASRGEDPGEILGRIERLLG